MSFRADRRCFTLPEVVAVLLILGLTASLAVPALRSEPPAAKLDRASLEFENFCARVRYQAMEKGRDRAVMYDASGGVFYDSDPALSESALPDGVENDADSALFRWRPPEGFECSLPETLSGTGEGALEIFRFYPDGGASGGGRIVLRCGKYARVLEVSLLTGMIGNREAADDDTEDL